MRTHLMRYRVIPPSAPSNLNLGISESAVFPNLRSHKEVPMNKKYIVQLTDEERSVC